MRRVWKLVGLAGIAGVAATGVALARAERRRAAYTPEQVRERLHARYEAVGPALREPLAGEGPRTRAGWARWTPGARHRHTAPPQSGPP